MNESNDAEILDQMRTYLSAACAEIDDAGRIYDNLTDPEIRRVCYIFIVLLAHYKQQLVHIERSLGKLAKEANGDEDE